MGANNSKTNLENNAQCMDKQNGTCGAFNSHPLNKLLLEACKEFDIEKVADLINRGASINATNAHGQTALISTVTNRPVIATRKMETILYLLEKGANPYIADSSGSNFLFYLISNISRIHVDIFEQLMHIYTKEGFGNINYKNGSGSTLLHVLFEQTSSREFWNHSSSGDWYFDGQKVYYILKSYGADINIQNEIGDTIIHIVLQRSSLDEVMYFILRFIQDGIDVNCKNKYSQIALHCYYKSLGFNNYKDTSRCQNLIEIPLLKAGSNPNVVDFEGNVPLVIFLKVVNLNKNKVTNIPAVRCVLRSILFNLQAGLYPKYINKYMTGNCLIKWIFGIACDYETLFNLEIVYQLGVPFESLDVEFIVQKYLLRISKQSEIKENPGCLSEEIVQKIQDIITRMKCKPILPLKRLSANAVLMSLNPNSVVGINNLELPMVLKSYMVIPEYQSVTSNVSSLMNWTYP